MASKPLAQELRIVLMGKTGTGRSASGNTILGIKCFKAAISSSSVTKECSAESRNFQGQKLTVVDTPGLFHTSKDKKEVMREIVGSIELTHQGPHVFLWVVDLSDSFRNEDKKSIDTYKLVFPSAAKHTIVLFTHGDTGNAETFIDRNPALKKFIEWSNDQYHVFNNDLEGDDGQGQVEDLVEKINKIEQNESFYHADLIEKAHKAIKELKVQPEESPAVGCKAKVTWWEQIFSERLTVIEKQLPFMKEFLEKLCELAEKMIEH